MTQGGVAIYCNRLGVRGGSRWCLIHFVQKSHEVLITCVYLSMHGARGGEAELTVVIPVITDWFFWLYLASKQKESLTVVMFSV